jgi:hypothetical protein
VLPFDYRFDRRGATHTVIAFGDNRMTGWAPGCRFATCPLVDVSVSVAIIRCPAAARGESRSGIAGAWAVVWAYGRRFARRAGSQYRLAVDQSSPFRESK